jgi:hypothetical protein
MKRNVAVTIRGQLRRATKRASLVGGAAVAFQTGISCEDIGLIVAQSGGQLVLSGASNSLVGFPDLVQATTLATLQSLFTLLLGGGV